MEEPHGRLVNFGCNGLKNRQKYSAIKQPC